MGLRFTCPSCASAVTSFDHGPGEQIVCDACGNEIFIPTEPTQTEHITDPTAPLSDPLVTSVATAQAQRWRLIVNLFLWLLLIVNPMAGIIILTTILDDPSSMPVSMIPVGVLLIVSAIFVVAIMRLRRWGVGGYTAIYIVLIVICAVQMNWEILFKLVGALGVFYLIVRSEWARLS